MRIGGTHLRRRKKTREITPLSKRNKTPNEPPPVGNYPRDAWGNLSQNGELPRLENTRGEILSPLYVDRTDTRHNPIPHMCLKIPTGGGKTLLGNGGVWSH